MESQFLYTIVSSAFSAVAIVIGIYLVLSREAWAIKNSVFFVSFSAGVILAVAFTHIMAESLELAPHALSVILFTIIAFYIFEHTITIHTCREGECEVHTIGTLAFSGIFVHSLLDGVVIGIGFEADFAIGLAAAIAVLLHKLPVGITTTAIMLHSGFKRRRTVRLAWMVALATPAGALLAYIFMRGLGDAALGYMLAFSAGSLIYVGASDLLPETHKNFNKVNILLVLVGVALVYLASYFTGGGHGHGGHAEKAIHAGHGGHIEEVHSDHAGEEMHNGHEEDAAHAGEKIHN